MEAEGTAPEIRKAGGWGWVPVDGALPIAIPIAARWPQDSIGRVGILVGFCLISGGILRIMLGRALRAGPPVA